MKVLFLDMDGVLVTRRPGCCETKLVENLRYIIETTGAKIVLSTDWRRTPAARSEVKRILNAHGGMDFIGWTTTNTPVTLNHRPIEIMQWLRDRNRKVRKEGWEPSQLVDHFVAIDDRTLLQEKGGQNLAGHFVNTHTARGLTRSLAEAAIKCLERKWEEPQPGVKAQAQPPSSDGPLIPGVLRSHQTPGQKSIILARNDVTKRVGNRLGRSTSSVPSGTPTSRLLPKPAEDAASFPDTGRSHVSPMAVKFGRSSLATSAMSKGPGTESSRELQYTFSTRNLRAADLALQQLKRRANM